MKKLELNQMEMLEGGLTDRQKGCFLSGLAAGAAAGCNPFVGAFTTAACFYLTPV